MTPEPEIPDRAVVAAHLRELAELVALEDGNPYRAKAYAAAADAIEALPEDLASVVRAKRLRQVRGIGQAIERVILELAATGRIERLEQLRDKFPPGVVALSRVLTPAQARTVQEALGIADLVELRQACVDGRLRGLKGFGAKTEQRLLEKIDAAGAPERALLPDAVARFEALAAYFRRLPAVVAVDPAGELRRRVETVDHIDLMVVATDVDAVAARLEKDAATLGTLSRDGARYLLRRTGVPPAEITIVTPAEQGPAWIGATGSAAHVEKLERLAAARGLTLAPDGLRHNGEALVVRDEGEVYGRLGLPFIAPELRDDAGEVEAGLDGSLPDDLVRIEDVQGAVHCHTVASDGRATIEEMARAAEALGMRYLTITDHSTSASYAQGLDADRLRRQRDEIARVQERVGVRLLCGTESDILRDGALDYPDAVLRQLDVVIASVHNRFRLDPEAMTQRLLRAMRHPLFKIWGHALGRYVLTRPPFACDVEAVLDAVAESRAAIEINGDPHRLDLEPRWIRAARRRGIRFVISSDAHSTAALANLRWGVDMARRGWVRRGEVLNTLDVDSFAAAVKP